MTQAELFEKVKRAIAERDDFHLKMCAACDEAARLDAENDRLKQERDEARVAAFDILDWSRYLGCSDPPCPWEEKYPWLSREGRT